MPSLQDVLGTADSSLAGYVSAQAHSVAFFRPTLPQKCDPPAAARFPAAPWLSLCVAMSHRGDALPERNLIMSFDLAHEPALHADNTGAEPVQQPTAAPNGAEFAALGLAPEIVKAIAHSGYASPTDVQSRTVPLALTGKDLMVSSQTGSGKTAAFVWPALQRILEDRKSVV